jgi:hypothetical protein
MTLTYQTSQTVGLAETTSNIVQPDESGTMLSIALKLILFSLFVPVELSFFIGGLRLTVTRLIFIILIPIVFARLGQKAMLGNYRFVASDLFVPLATVWMFVGPTVTQGLDDALAHSGPVALEYLIGYMSTRVLLLGNDDPLRFVGLTCLTISFVVADALLDTVTGRYFTHELSQQITGFNYGGYSEDSYRFGLLRASGPLEHPILFGFAAAIGLLLAASTEIRWKKLCTAACALGLIICISSAPMQSAMIGFGLLLFDRMFARLQKKWLMLSIVPIVLTVTLFATTSTPFGHLFDSLTIDPATAYYRLYIWNEVGPAILGSPIFGVLESAYEYHGTVDSIWLVLSLAYGMPCAILVALSMIGACSLPTAKPRATLSRANARLGTALGIVIFVTIFMGFTVSLWGPTWILVAMLLGLRAHLGELGRLNQSSNLENASGCTC